MEAKRSVHHAVVNRQYGLYSNHVFAKNIRASKVFARCLQRNTNLLGHDGCVNTISWNDVGTLLVSGSDDCFLNIYQPFQNKLVHNIRSGHRANIFSAKFLPCTSDKKIISCAGDGMIQFTEVDRESLYGHFPFNCHSGTAYEIITTPGDPHTFLSCGEDGTVRLYDLRTKNKCICQECKEDILIDCDKAVTSISINPLIPYHLAIGCEDSTVRIFDRRTLSTDRQSSMNNQMHGMFSQFRPKRLKSRTCRVTSLQHSDDGDELLVSFCSDYVYLFDVNGKSEEEEKEEAKQRELDRKMMENGVHSEDSENAANIPPLKRLRLRGDWSDTGPNARPESEQPTAESSLMQRMSDMFTRWLDESFRDAQRRRSERAMESASSTSTSPSSSPAPGAAGEGGEAEDNEVSANGEIEEEVFVGPSIEEQYVDEGVENSDSKSKGEVNNEEGGVQDNVDFDGDLGRESSVFENSDSCQGSSMEEKLPDCDCCDEACAKVEHNGVHEDDDASLTGVKNHTNNSSFSSSDNDLTNSIINPTYTPVESLEKNEQNSDLRMSELADNSSVSSASYTTASEAASPTTEALPSSLYSHKMDVACSSQSESAEGIEDKVAFMEIKSQSVSQSSDHVETEMTEQTTGNSGESNEPAVERTEPASVEAEGEISPAQAAATLRARNIAASRIQAQFYRMKKYRMGIADLEKRVRKPGHKMFYHGHRNARTMIKEANFWGESYVCSGSDCGRIFVWDKYSGEIVNLLQGDRHVVNCVQPHPTYPVLATSGIDYDIKLWTPTGGEPTKLEELQEVVSRNERMLEESRDTITVPASFMLRVLAALNYARIGRNQGQGEEETDSSDED